MSDTLTRAVEAADSERPNVFSRLYRGETSFDFVGRRRWWFAISAVVIAVGLISLGTRGLNLGIEFKGGTQWQVKTSALSVNQARDAVATLGLNSATIEVLGTGNNRTLEVQDNLASLSATAKKAKIPQVETKLASAARVPVSSVSITDIGPTWGHDITSKAVRALIVFLVLITIYITFRFEWRMALAAVIAMIHDILVTVGIYSLSGFEVTPATVIAFLTILGYSLYDTIVVFDRVQENAKGLGATGRMTISNAVNLSMNQVLARSVNTSLVAILPILSVLVIGAQLLGATTLQQFGLALFIGLTTGAYSSIFIASPLLAVIKEHEPRYVSMRQRLESRGAGGLGLLTPAAAAAGVYGRDGSGSAATGNGAPRPGGQKRVRATAGPGSRRPQPAGGPSGSGRPAGAKRPPPRPRKKRRR